MAPSLLSLLDGARETGGLMGFGTRSARGALAPPAGVRRLGARVPGVSLRSTPGYSLATLRVASCPAPLAARCSLLAPRSSPPPPLAGNERAGGYRAALHAAVESGLVQMAEMKRFAEAKHLKWADLWPVNQRHNSVK